MSRANAEGVDGADRQRAAGPGAHPLSPVEDWLQRAMADLSARGADDDAPIDLSQSLAAMAALLNGIVQSKPIRAAPGPSAPSPGVENRGEPDGRRRNQNGNSDREHEPPTLSAGAEVSSAEAFASTDADGGESLTELTQRLDEIEQRLRAGGGLDDDRRLKSALTEIEARLRKSAARRAELAKSRLKADHPTSGSLGEPRPRPPASSATSGGEGQVGGSSIGEAPQTGETPALSSTERVADLEASIRDLTALTKALQSARRDGWPHEELDRSLRAAPQSREQAAHPIAGPQRGGAAKDVCEDLGAFPAREAKPLPVSKPQAAAQVRHSAPAPVETAAMDGAASTPMHRPTATRRDPVSDGVVSHLAVENIEAELCALTRKAEEVIARSCDSGPYDALTECVATAEKHLTKKLESGLAAAAVETDGLKDLVRKLADKMEAAREAAASDLAIQSLEREIGAIAERLDGADKGLSCLASLEQSINRLFEQVAEIRKIASMPAARKAGRDGAPRPDLDEKAEGDDHDGQLTREIADLRAARDEADKRIHLALNAVQETVGKVADRLTKMEADLGEMRPARDRLLPLLAPRAEPRQRGDQEGDVFSTEALQRERLAAVPSPVLVKTKEGLPQSLFSRDAAQPPDTEGANVQKQAEPADFLIEPGSGFPRRREPREHPAPVEPPRSEREAGGGRADFIAAARRAVQAAQFDAEAPAGALKSQQRTEDHAGAAGGFFSTHRGPILLAIAALCLALGAYAAARIGSLKSLDPTSLLNAISKGAAGAALSTQRGGHVAGGAQSLAMPSATSAAKPTHAATPGFAAVKANAPLRDSRLFDPAPLDILSPLRQAPASVENPPLGKSAPLAHAIAGSDPIIVGAIAGRAGVIPSAPQPIVSPGPQPMVGAPTVIASLPGMPLEELRGKAEAGDARAQFELGARFADGRAGSQDMALAAQYYARAADQGLALAQYRLAVLSEKGVGVSRDLTRAQSLYLTAAEQGNARAMHNLGVLAAQGVDGEVDYANAARWFEKAAAFGIRDSQFNLAVLLARGSSLSHDAARSYSWFAIAAATGDEEAARKRDEMALKLSPADLAAATAAANAFRPRPLDPTVNEISVSGNRPIASAPAAVQTQKKAANL